MGYSISHRIGVTTTIIITLFSILSVVLADYNFGFNRNAQNFTRLITLKHGTVVYGKLQGIVVKTRLRGRYVPVEQYLGIQYAAPPEGKMRFMPTQTSPTWGENVKIADNFGHVCPQDLPDPRNMEPYRREYFKRLKEQYLMNESEDCLYLNIYAPYQERSIGKYPVMVFIHGESFEWNTGNAYDGSVLAAYGKVIVVTLNFRLGVLGFLKTGVLPHSPANYGLIDQIAALIWIRDNIREFGGDPDQVTLFGHGTGAACVSFLTLSPMALYGNGKSLFKRAILMSGTSLADWAWVPKRTSANITYRIVDSLNCPSDDEQLSLCLRKRTLQDIKRAVAEDGPSHITRFGPVVDNLVIRNEPEKLMTNYVSEFSRYELMYGLTEVESINLLKPVPLRQGMLEKEMDEELTEYMRVRCEIKPEKCIMDTLHRYRDSMKTDLNTRQTPATETRDMLLDILSDARSAAPMARMAKYHSAVNQQSYFYVFGHVTESKNSIRNKSVQGDELPYVFGIPLDNPGSYFLDQYKEEEKDLSEIIMTLWTNFAYSGNPTAYTNGKKIPIWPEFDTTDESYYYLGIPITIGRNYRKSELGFWNDEFPMIDISPIPNFYNNIPPFITLPYNRNPFDRPKVPPIATTEKPFYLNKKHDVSPFPDFPPRNHRKPEERHVITPSPMPVQSTGSTVNILISAGAVFLLFNIIMFSYLYHKCVIKRRKRNNLKRNIEDHTDTLEINTEKAAKVTPIPNGCSLMKMIATKSSKSGDTYEAVKTHESSSSKRKLTRQLSSSTIDAHTKVRDWIAQEIVNKYSPKLFRKSKKQTSTDTKPSNNNKKKKEKKSDGINNKVLLDDAFKMTGSNSTLGQSPTRPVSPVEDKKLLSAKPSLIPVQKPKKVEKISVAVDATPAGRGSSVMRQPPVELTKSLDYSSFDSGTDTMDTPLRRSVTVDDIFCMKSAGTQSPKSSSSINVQLQPIDEPTIIRIEHSKPDLNSTNSIGRKLKTFDPDINVTSRDEPELITPLTPEESLQTIKRRNFPKVLPDLPGENKQANIHKRRSMPAPNYLFLPIPENPSLSQPNSPTGKGLGKCPPAPPPRISSNLGKIGHTPLMQSAPAIAQEPPLPEEPEVACNNLYFGPLIPSRENRKIPVKPVDSYKMNNQPIYDNLNPKKIENPENSTRRVEPKVIIKPTISRQISDPSKFRTPRVVVNDLFMTPTKSDKEDKDHKNESGSPVHSGIPVLNRQNSKKGQHLTVNNDNKESSTDSTPSEGSDTGTVVKRV